MRALLLDLGMPAHGHMAAAALGAPAPANLACQPACCQLLLLRRAACGRCLGARARMVPSSARAALHGCRAARRLAGGPDTLVQPACASDDTPYVLGRGRLLAAFDRGPILAATLHSMEQTHAP